MIIIEKKKKMKFSFVIHGLKLFRDVLETKRFKLFLLINFKIKIVKRETVDHDNSD